MNKKDYLLEKLTDSAHVISLTALTASPDELADEIVDFMAIVHLCGQEGLMAPRTPKEAEARLQSKQDNVMDDFDYQEKQATD